MYYFCHCCGKEILELENPLSCTDEDGDKVFFAVMNVKIFLGNTPTVILGIIGKYVFPVNIIVSILTEQVVKINYRQKRDCGITIVVQLVTIYLLVGRYIKNLFV